MIFFGELIMEKCTVSGDFHVEDTTETLSWDEVCSVVSFYSPELHGGSEQLGVSSERSALCKHNSLLLLHTTGSELRLLRRWSCCSVHAGGLSVCRYRGGLLLAGSTHTHTQRRAVIGPKLPICEVEPVCHFVLTVFHRCTWIMVIRPLYL